MSNQIRIQVPTSPADIIGVGEEGVIQSTFTPVVKEPVKRATKPKESKVTTVTTEEERKLVKKEGLDLKALNKDLNTLRRAKIEASELQIIRRLPNIVKKAVEMAEEGDIQAMKMILDRVIPVTRAIDAVNPNSSSKGFQVNISINGSQDPSSLMVTPIEATEYEVVQDE